MTIESTNNATATGYKEVTITPCSSGFGEYQIGEANGDTWQWEGNLMHAMQFSMEDVGAKVTWDGDITRKIVGSIRNQDQLLHIMCAEHDNGDFDYFGIVEA